MPTRSTKFGSFVPTAGVWFPVLTVPAGMTYLVKSVVIRNNSAFTAIVNVRAGDPGGARGAMVYNRSILTVQGFEWNGWVALNAGDTLEAMSDQNFVDFWISGAKLVGTA
jgi:hypothetical protein